MSINRALGQAGAGYDIEWEGKRLTMLPLSELGYASLEKWMTQRAWRLCREAKEVLDPEEYRQLWEETRRDIEAGVYSLDSNTETAPELDEEGNPKLNSKGQPIGKRVPSKMLATSAATVEIVRLLFATRHPEITTEQTQRMMAEVGDEIEEGMIAIGEAAKARSKNQTPPLAAGANSASR